MKKILLTLMFVFLLSFACAEIESIGTGIRGECIDLIQTCPNCTYVNITSIIYPNLTEVDTDLGMTKIGTKYNYSFCGTDNIGEYIYNTEGDLDGITAVETLSFYINPSGQARLNTGEGISLLIPIIAMIIVAGFFLFIGTKFENSPKIVFFGISAICLIMVILFSIIIVMQNLGGYEAFVTGISTFWFVMKILTSIFVLILILYSGLMAWNMWQIHRGFRD